MKKTKRQTVAEPTWMPIVAIFHRIIRSVSFNIFMLILGFAVGFFNVTIAVHHNAVKNENYECVVELTQKMEELDVLDEEREVKQQEIRNLIHDFELKISHNTFNFDKILKH